MGVNRRKANEAKMEKVMEKCVFAIVAFAVSLGQLYALNSPLPYERFGEFRDIGTSDYKYQVIDPEGLKNIVPQGIYPNTPKRAKGPKITREEIYAKTKILTLSDEDCLNFWGAFDPARSQDRKFTEGVRHFYWGGCLEKAARIQEAIFAYYALVVHFPNEMDPVLAWPNSWSQYLGAQAMDRLYFLTRQYPHLGLRYAGGEIAIDNGFDSDYSDDVLRIWPGRLLSVEPQEVVPPSQDLSGQKIVYERGSASGVRLVRFNNGHWQLRVKGEPFVIRGVDYFPGSIASLYPDLDSDRVYGELLKNDTNNNGLLDLWETWLDGNKDNKLDETEPKVSDFALMAMMGANTVRFYHHPPEAKLLDEAHAQHGLYFILGDNFGGLSADYLDPSTRAKIMASVEDLVRAYKDKAYVLAWSLGGGHRALEGKPYQATPRAYYAFANEVTKRIHEIDPNHPVILVNDDLNQLDAAANLAGEADILGVNAYRGFHGFGQSFWAILKSVWRRPVILMEYGAPSYAEGVETQRAEELQSFYHIRAWRDIDFNTAGHPGSGNALGGCVFEWVDEWWRGGELPFYKPEVQETAASGRGPFLDGGSYGEFFGIMSQGDGKNSPFLRQPRKVFWNYLKLWKKN